MKRGLVIGSLLFATLSSAFAGPATTVFPLSAPNLPMKIASAPEELSKALAKELDGEVAPLPIEDAAAISGCDAEATTCLETVSKSYKSKRIVFGQISMLGEDRLRVTLTRFDPGPDRQQSTYTVDGTVDHMAEELVKLSRPLFGGEEEEEEEEVDPPLGGGGTKEPFDDRKGSVSPGSWFLIGGGVVLAAVGAGFLVSAASYETRVNTFRMPETPADFIELRSLETTGAQRRVIGAVTVGLGAALGLYGIVRAVSDRSSPPEKVSRIVPMPIDGGAALVFTMEMR